MDSENSKGLSEDERRYISEVLSDFADLVMRQLGDDFLVKVEADYKEIPLWITIKVQPYEA